MIQTDPLGKQLYNLFVRQILDTGLSKYILYKRAAFGITMIFFVNPNAYVRSFSAAESGMSLTSNVLDFPSWK
jgi:hypothetical protein